MNYNYYQPTDQTNDCKNLDLLFRKSGSDAILYKGIT
jgi:hypothetical protein